MAEIKCIVASVPGKAPGPSDEIFSEDEVTRDSQLTAFHREA